MTAKSSTTLPSGQSESGGPLVLRARTDGIATVTLNRPEKYNSLVRPMALELLKALSEASADNSVRAIVLAGRGKAFCTGQDLEEVMPAAGQLTNPGAANLGAIVEQLYNPIVQVIASARKPVIASVAGIAAGAGANIALACDFVVAAHSAVFIQAFAKVGLIPDSGGTFFLPRLVGLGRAKALTMLAEKISAEEMYSIGAIYKVVPDVELEPAVTSLARALAAGPTHALGLTKQLLNGSHSCTLQEQLAKERECQQACGEHAEYSVGITAFIEKKTPLFTKD